LIVLCADNKTDVGSIKSAYSDKETQVREGVGKCRAAVRKLNSKDSNTPLWRLILAYLESYTDGLFQRLQKTRRQGNEFRCVQATSEVVDAVACYGVARSKVGI
jgi:hypothetical protein